MRLSHQTVENIRRNPGTLPVFYLTPTLHILLMQHPLIPPFPAIRVTQTETGILFEVPES